MQNWIERRNIERFEKLLATDVADDVRVVIEKLLELERSKLAQPQEAA